MKYDILVKRWKEQWNMEEISEIMQEDGYTHYIIINGWEEFGEDIDFMVISDRQITDFDAKLYINHYINQEI